MTFRALVVVRHHLDFSFLFSTKTPSHDTFGSKIVFLFAKTSPQADNMGLIPAKGDEQGTMLIAVSSILLALAIVAVLLRIWSRRLKRRSLVTNDYLVLLVSPPSQFIISFPPLPHHNLCHPYHNQTTPEFHIHVYREFGHSITLCVRWRWRWGDNW